MVRLDPALSQKYPERHDVLAVPVFNIGGEDPPLAIVAISSKYRYIFAGHERRFSVGLGPYVGMLKVLYLLRS
jgi:hypothetical protein